MLGEVKGVIKSRARGRLPKCKHIVTERGRKSPLQRFKLFVSCVQNVRGLGVGLGRDLISVPCAALHETWQTPGPGGHAHFLASG